MLYTKLFALMPFGVLGILSAVEPYTYNFVEYGALGICGVAVVMLFRQLSEMRQVHKSERENLVLALERLSCDHKKERADLVLALRVLNDRFAEIIEKNVAVNDRFTEAMHDRPCLLKDSRIQHNR
jgi:hypothetical protein